MMKLQIPFSDIEAMIRRKSGRDIKLKPSSGINTVNVSYTVKTNIPFLGEVSKALDVDVKINGIQGMEVDIQYTFNKCIDLVVKAVRAFLGEKIEKTDILKWGEKENQVFLCIDKLAEKCNVEGVGKMQNKVEVGTISVLADGFEVCFTLKMH